MIKKLRHKFIAVSVLSVFLVLLVIMGAINILNYRRMVDDSDKVLNVLAENNGEFPKRDSGFKHRETRGDWFFNAANPTMHTQTQITTEAILSASREDSNFLIRSQAINPIHPA